MAATLSQVINKEVEVGIDELNGLFPEVVAVVLAREGLQVGDAIGSWTVIEDDENHRGFTSKVPSILSDRAEEIAVFQLEPGLLAIGIYAAAFEVSGVMDFRVEPNLEGTHTARETALDKIRDAADALKIDEREQAAQALTLVNLSLVSWLLNIDLLDYLSGDPVIPHDTILDNLPENLRAFLNEEDNPELDEV